MDCNWRNMRKKSSICKIYVLYLELKLIYKGPDDLTGICSHNTIYLYLQTTSRKINFLLNGNVKVWMLSFDYCRRDKLERNKRAGFSRKSFSTESNCWLFFSGWLAIWWAVRQLSWFMTFHWRKINRNIHWSPRLSLQDVNIVLSAFSYSRSREDALCVTIIRDITPSSPGIMEAGAGECFYCQKLSSQVCQCGVFYCSKDCLQIHRPGTYCLPFKVFLFSMRLAMCAQQSQQHLLGELLPQRGALSGGGSWHQAPGARHVGCGWRGGALRWQRPRVSRVLR